MGISLIDDGTLDANKSDCIVAASGLMRRLPGRHDREHHKSGALRMVTPKGV